MPFDLGLDTTAALAIALLGAAIVRGYSGFGFSAIFIAFAALLTNPLPLIPVIFLCEMLMTLFQAKDIRGHIDWRRVVPLLVGAAITIPFAVGLIVTAGETPVRLTISAIILMMSVALLAGWQFKKSLSAFGHVCVGFLSGMCNAAGVGGLPVAAFLSAQPIAPPQFRATMIVFLTGLDLITLPWMWHGGLITPDTAMTAAMAFPILGIGVWLGGRHFLATSPQSFRQFAVFLLLILSAMGLLRAWMT